MDYSWAPLLCQIEVLVLINPWIMVQNRHSIIINLTIMYLIDSYWRFWVGQTISVPMLSSKSTYDLLVKRQICAWMMQITILMSASHALSDIHITLACDLVEIGQKQSPLRDCHGTMVLPAGQNTSPKLSQGTQTEVSKLQNSNDVSNTARASTASRLHQRWTLRR